MQLNQCTYLTKKIYEKQSLEMTEPSVFYRLKPVIERTCVPEESTASRFYNMSIVINLTLRDCNFYNQLRTLNCHYPQQIHPHSNWLFSGTHFQSFLLHNPISPVLHIRSCNFHNQLRTLDCQHPHLSHNHYKLKNELI